jgi:hypothetical protein
MIATCLVIVKTEASSGIIFEAQGPAVITSFEQVNSSLSVFTMILLSCSFHEFTFW